MAQQTRVLGCGALAEAGLREAFDGLSYSHRREHVNAISDAKKPETQGFLREASSVRLETPSLV